MNKTESQQLKDLIGSQKFEAAKNLLNSSKSIELPVKYYNLGYLSLQKEDFPMARYQFELAQKSGLYNVELDKALEETKVKLGIDQVESSLPTSEILLMKAIKVQSDVYMSVGILLIIIFSIALFKSNKILAAISGLVGSCLLAFTLFSSMTFDEKIIFEEAIVYQGPSRIFEQIQKIPSGLYVVTKKKTGDWVKVIYPQDYAGWIYQAKAKKL